MRSEDSAEVEDVCDDPFVQAACLMGSDKCPAACQEETKEDNTDEKEDVVVKSGDLAVSATANSTRKALIGATSDLDTLTFKTSEEVEISRITLERYGYSKDANVANIWLEDENGNKIADEKDLNSKGQVTLNLKKGYKTVDGQFFATVVVDLNPEAAADLAEAGSTIGFKVVSVESTAENLNLSNYTPYTYETVKYDGTKVILTAKSTEKEYNYEAGEAYEISRFKLKSSDSSALTVKGFTLSKGTANSLDAEDFISKVAVSVDGEKVSGLKYSFDSDDNLVVSFSDLEIAAKKTATIVVSAEFEDLDEYGKTIQYQIGETTDLNAIEKKTDARVSVIAGYDDAEKTISISTLVWPSYKFNGGKIRLTNTKLGNIDAAAGSTNVVIAEGEITVNEAIKGTFVLNANNSGIEALSMTINGTEYDAKVSNSQKTFTFKNVEIEKSGKIQFKADVDSDAVKDTIIKVDTFKAAAFNNEKGVSTLQYVDSDKNATVEIAGSISFSDLTVNAAKASLENNLDKDVEFIVDSSSSRKAVFEGTYTAKKTDIYLNKFTISGSPITDDNEITLYVTIDGEGVGEVDLNKTTTKGTDGFELDESFSNIKVKAGESVKVLVEAEFDGSTSSKSYDFTLQLEGDDNDGNDQSGVASDTLVTIKTKTTGTITVTASTTKDTVLLKKANQSFVKFTVKPSNSSDDDLTLDTLNLSFTPTVAAKDIRVKIDGTEYDVAKGETELYKPNAKIKDGIDVEVIFKKAVEGEYVLTVTANDKTKTFNRAYAPALVYLESQENEGDYTHYSLAVESYDDDYTVTNLRMYSDAACSTELSLDGISSSDELESGDTFDITNEKTSVSIACIEYDVYLGTTSEVPAQCVDADGKVVEGKEATEASCTNATKNTLTIKPAQCVDADGNAVEGKEATEASCTNATENTLIISNDQCVDADGNAVEGKEATEASCTNATENTLTIKPAQCVDADGKVVEGKEATEASCTNATENTLTIKPAQSDADDVVEVSISKTTYADYFKVGGTTWRVFSNN